MIAAVVMAGVVLLGLMAWDGWRRYLAHERVEQSQHITRIEARMASMQEQLDHITQKVRKEGFKR